MSPQELAREFEAAHLRQEDAYDLAITQAWMTNYVYVVTKSKSRMPDLKNLLSGGKRKHQQSHDQMLSQLQSLANVTGYKLRNVKPTVH